MFPDDEKSLSEGQFENGNDTLNDSQPSSSRLYSGRVGVSQRRSRTAPHMTSCTSRSTLYCGLFVQSCNVFLRVKRLQFPCFCGRLWVPQEDHLTSLA